MGGITQISNDDWKLVSADSSHSSDYSGEKAFDGDISTMWHTPWNTGAPNFPHEIVIDTGKSQEVNELGFIARQNASNDIQDYEFFVSEDGVNWGEPVAKGTLADTKEEILIPFNKKTGRYIKFKALNSRIGQPWATIAELILYTSANSDRN
ncbi:discoidin domain-containing protein [Peribacillus muralis]|uniref:discoidin domain-containing protein n=1 Tax=Peribacillus muralis TaxID=264697 RepID=UPI0022A9847E|nr:discoidin domain-containing protein [Peribacillus muralis]